MLKGLGGLGDMAKMMKAAQEMQRRRFGARAGHRKRGIDGAGN
jgi:hypothetical protein